MTLSHEQFATIQPGDRLTTPTAEPMMLGGLVERGWALVKVLREVDQRIYQGTIGPPVSQASRDADVVAALCNALTAERDAALAQVAKLRAALRHIHGMPIDVHTSNIIDAALKGHDPQSPTDAADHDPRAEGRDYRRGRDANFAGRPLVRGQNIDWQRGWQDAEDDRALDDFEGW
jgi:hypothetical protein